MSDTPIERSEDRIERTYSSVKGFPARNTPLSLAITLGIAFAWVFLVLWAMIWLSAPAWLGVAVAVGLPLAAAIKLDPGKNAPSPVIITPRRVGVGQELQVDARCHKPIDEVAFVTTKRVRSYSENRTFDQKRVTDVVLKSVIVDGAPGFDSYRGTIPKNTSTTERWFVAISIGGPLGRLLAYPLEIDYSVQDERLT